MQRRLSPRSSGIVESVGSGGGSDSELKPVTPEIKTEIPSLKSTSAQVSPTPATQSVNGSEGAVTPANPATGGGNGQLWLNSSTHVYHKQGSRFYGEKTRHGKYLSEQDAIKGGDHAAKNEH
jgi:hypothetical protein